MPASPGSRLLAVSNVFAGAVNSRGEALYSTFPYDPGLISEDWAQWEFVNSITNRDPSAAFIFTTPPSEPGALADTRAIALAFDMDADAGKISDTDSTYTESAMSFMTPPDPTDLDELRGRGAKMIVVHGASDPVFSVDDTTRWYESLTAKYGDTTSDFARFFRVPGMGHSRGGPSTDQYDGLSALGGLGREWSSTRLHHRDCPRSREPWRCKPRSATVVEAQVGLGRCARSAGSALRRIR